jgi:hypothetical protein
VHPRLHRSDSKDPNTDSGTLTRPGEYTSGPGDNGTDRHDCPNCHHGVHDIAGCGAMGVTTTDARRAR